MNEMLRVSAPVVGRSGEYTLRCTGELDGVSYRALRDSVVEAALDEPRVVIVDVNELHVPDASAWSVFSSARWLVRTWPDVPILLVCANDAARQLIRQGGITRYVPAFATMRDALQSMDDEWPRPRRRARAELPAHVSSIIDAQRLIGGWLSGWSCAPFIPGAATVAAAFVENVLRQTDSAPTLRAEYDGRVVAIAVEDGSATLAQRREEAHYGTSHLSGLAMVTALARVWGNLPTPRGKIVWAVMGHENVL
jgi:anti-anti-sigma factor